jgi:hypothetical protein
VPRRTSPPSSGGGSSHSRDRSGLVDDGLAESSTYPSCRGRTLGRAISRTAPRPMPAPRGPARARGGHRCSAPSSSGPARGGGRASDRRARPGRGEALFWAKNPARSSV